MAKGKLFVIEGLDGSGKQTQSELLVKRLKEEGYNVLRASYPNYESDSSALVKMYLNGDFGNNAEDIDPKVASTFYAVDRYATYKKEYEEFYNNGGIIIADRYVTSNMLHQGCKIKDIKKREEFLNWLLDYEYNMFKIPTPDKIFFLDIDPKVSQKLIKDRDNKFTNEHEKDIHESNFEYLMSAYENVNFLIKNYGFERIECVEDNKLKSIEEINNDLYKRIKNNLGGNTMKLIIAIVQNEDAFILSDALTDEGYQVTKLSTMGGFLKLKNVTLMIGTEDEKVERALEIMKKICKKREQVVSTPVDASFMESPLTTYSASVEVGGATVFILDVARFEKY